MAADTVLPFHVVTRQHVGLVRDHQEDGTFSDPAQRLFAVFDGMGGGRSGDYATEAALGVFSHAMLTPSLEPTRQLDALLLAANAAILDFADENRFAQGIGCAAAALWLIDERWAVVSHVGDARAYLQREGAITPLTRDHNLINAYTDMLGDTMDEDQLEQLQRYRNVLTRALGIQRAPHALASHTLLPIQPGDRLLICSDGIHEELDAQALRRILSAPLPSLEHTADALVEGALQQGGRDNISLVLLELTHPEALAPPCDTSLEEREALAFGELRSACHPPNPESWQRCCEAIDALRHDPDAQQRCLDYLASHTAHWPAHLPRLIPTLWIAALQHATSPPHAHLAICDTWRTAPGHVFLIEDFEFLWNHDSLAHIERVEFGHDALTREHLLFLASSPHTARLTHFQYELRELDPSPLLTPESTLPETLRAPLHAHLEQQRLEERQQAATT